MFYGKLRSSKEKKAWKERRKVGGASRQEMREGKGKRVTLQNTRVSRAACDGGGSSTPSSSLRCCDFIMLHRIHLI